VPEAVSDARGGAAGAATALVGARTRHALGDERGEACRRVVGGDAAEAGVHDDADAFDGERGLGNGGRQHDLAAAGRRGSNGAVLLVGGELAVEWGDVGVRWNAVLEALGSAGDLGLAGEENENRALVGLEGGEHGGCHLILEAL
jgi:hypothetical protein